MPFQIRDPQNAERRGKHTEIRSRREEGRRRSPGVWRSGKYVQIYRGRGSLGPWQAGSQGQSCSQVFRAPGSPLPEKPCLSFQFAKADKMIRAEASLSWASISMSSRGVEANER